MVKVMQKLRKDWDAKDYLLANKSFFMDPIIIADAEMFSKKNPEPTPKMDSSLAKVAAVPFMTKYTVKINEQAGAVFNGDKLIASIQDLNHAVTDKAYRKQGIGKALIVAWVKKNPKVLFGRTPVRTVGGAKVYQQAYAELTAG